MRKFTLILAALLGGTSMVLAGCNNDPGEQETEKKVTKVTMTCESKVMVGKTIKATANVTVSGGASKAVTWSSSDTTVATVDSTGKITGKKVGKVTITVKSKVDNTKFASKEVSVVEAAWSDAEKEMMNTYLGEEVPYFPGSFTWTDEYYDLYGCLSAESYVVADATKVINQFKADSSFEYSYDSEYDMYTFTRDAKDPLYDFCLDVYEDEDYDTGKPIAVVDAYVQIKSYSEWPTDLIADLLEEAGFDVTLPSYSAKVADTVSFIAAYVEDEEGGYVNIVVSGDEDATDTPEDYLAKFDETFSTREYDDGYGGKIYLVSDSAKKVTIEILGSYDYDESYDIVQYPGFELIVCDYIPDYDLKLLPVLDIYEVGGGDINMDLIKGSDYGDDDVIVFESSDDTIASVSQTGVVTPHKAGSVEISAYFGDKADPDGYAVSLLHFVDAIPTDFTPEQKDEFKKLDDIEFTIPFNKYYTDVKYNDVESYVTVTGLYVSSDVVEEIYQGMIADGWADIDASSYATAAEEYDMTVDEARIAMYEYYRYYSFEKKVEDHYIGADLYLVVYDEEEDENVLSTEGNVRVGVYDSYLYSYADAKKAAFDIIDEMEVETTAQLPEAMPGDHFYVGYDDEYNCVNFYAYNSHLTLDNIVTAFTEAGWDVEKFHEAATATTPEIDGVYGYSADEVLEVEAYIDGDNAIIYVYLPGAAAGEQITDEADLEDGMEIYIVCMDKEMGISAYNGSKNFSSTSVEDAENLMVLVLTDNGDGTWGLEDEDGNAYGANSKKEIKTSGSGVNFDWEIEFDEDGNALMYCGDWVLMFNTDNECFKTYTEGMSTGVAVQIFAA